MSDDQRNDLANNRWLSRLALIVTFVLMLARLSLTEHVGFGDAEALYVVYSMYDQATFLDHPGLIGWLGRVLATGREQLDPVAIHWFTSLAATAICWLVGAAARGAGAKWRGTLIAVIAMSVVPEFAVGLFAYTPDIPLAIAWIGALGFGAMALGADAKSTKSYAATIATGLCAGLACASKASGVLLAVALVATWLAPGVRHRFKTFAPYAALIVGIAIPLPMIVREASLGWPMLMHRLVDTQIGFGPSIRNVGGLIGGQLLYLTPFVAVAAVLVAIHLTRHATDNPIDRLLFNTSVPVFVVLSVLTILSRVAEPHWVAPSYLGLVVYLARHPEVVSRRLAKGSIYTSLAAIALVFVVVRFPLLPKVMGPYYRARYDLTNDLYAWRSGIGAVRRALSDVRNASIDRVTVLGPHWIVCAQVKAALGDRVKVGCESPNGDDFSQWHPREKWIDDTVLLYVTDDRFDVDVRSRFTDRVIQQVHRVSVRRGGVVVRKIRVLQLGKMGSASLEQRSVKVL